MELNRNHYIVIGVVLILLGIQLKVVDSFVLNEAASQRLLPKGQRTLTSDVVSFTQMAAPVTARKTIPVPSWVGWLVISAGAVLTLHAVAMPKAGG
jgi:hypothetical protein